MKKQLHGRTRWALPFIEFEFIEKGYVQVDTNSFIAFSYHITTNLKIYYQFHRHTNLYLKVSLLNDTLMI